MSFLTLHNSQITNGRSHEQPVCILWDQTQTKPDIRVAIKRLPNTLAIFESEFQPRVGELLSFRFFLFYTTGQATWLVSLECTYLPYRKRLPPVGGNGANDLQTLRMSSDSIEYASHVENLTTFLRPDEELCVAQS